MLSKQLIPGATLKLDQTFLHLTDDYDAVRVDVNDDFWQTVGGRAALNEGRLMCALNLTNDWTHWEMHPTGDEIVYLISGAIEVVLQLTHGEFQLRLTAGRAGVIPKGVWHSTNVLEPSQTLHVTPGSGTQQRPRRGHGDDRKGRS